MSHQTSILLPTKLKESIIELVGAIYGDGTLSKGYNNTYSVRLTGNLSKDEHYFLYLQSLFVTHFLVYPSISINRQKSSITLCVYSKLLVRYFNETLHIPIGKKILSAIPTYITRNQPFLCAFIRGLFDTDGCVTFQRDGKYTYVLIKLTTKFLLFAESIKHYLSTLGIHSYICKKNDYMGNVGYDVVVRNKECEKFFMIIESHNSRNIKKWGCRDSNSRNDGVNHHFP